MARRHSKQRELNIQTAVRLRVLLKHSENRPIRHGAEIRLSVPEAGIEPTQYPRGAQREGRGDRAGYRARREHLVRHARRGGVGIYGAVNGGGEDAVVDGVDGAQSAVVAHGAVGADVEGAGLALVELPLVGLLARVHAHREDVAIHGYRGCWICWEGRRWSARRWCCCLSICICEGCDPVETGGCVADGDSDVRYRVEGRICLDVGVD